MNKKILFGLITTVPILLISIVQIHNISLLPVDRGFDAPAHIDYINYLKNQKKLPLPYEGWELWQAPLYYYIAAMFSDIKSVQILGLVSWFILLILSLIFFKKTFKDSQISLIGTLIIGSLPVNIYLTPAISNEFFSGVIISLTLIYYLLTKNNNKVQTKIILGILMGLAILSKATALLLVFTIFLDQIWQKGINIKQFFRKMIVPFVIMTIVGGWFYIKNIYLFKNPLVTSFDFSKHPLTQPIIPRNLEFFTTFKGFFNMDLFHSQYYSFLSGTYFSWFYDGHNVIIPVQSYSKIGIILVIFSIPIFIFFIIGFIKALFHLSSNNRVLVSYSVFLFASYILYNFKLPFYSTVKGSFIVSSIIPFGYFFIKGIEKYKKYFNFIYISFNIYFNNYEKFLDTYLVV